MANELRDSRDYFFGTLSVAAAISDTTLTAAAFANLAATGTYSSTRYLPLVLHDPALGVYEVVWVTAHTTSSTSVTVSRGKEGTAARAWPSGTQVVQAPLIRDGVPILTSGTLPSDPHTGMRVMQSDLGTLVKRSKSAGWQPDVGVALPADIGPGIDGSTNPPTDATILLRTGLYGGTTDANGDRTITFRTPFPNGVVSCVLTSTRFSPKGPLVVTTLTVSGATFRTYDGTSAAVSAAINGFYVAVGW